MGCSVSPQRPSRKYSTTSSSGSSSTPSTPTSIVLPKGGGITVSPVGTFFPASPRVAQAVYVQSPPSASSADSSQPSPSLVSVPTVFQVAGQPFSTPLNIFQPGAAGAAQQLTLMQPAAGSQQPVLMMVPSATNVQQLGAQNPAQVLQGLQLPQVVVGGGQQNPDQIPQATAALLAAQQSPSQPQGVVQVQLNGRDKDASSVENQLRLQIAHLQQQLVQSSRATSAAAGGAQQTGSLEKDTNSLAAQSQLCQLSSSAATCGGYSPSKVAIATTAATATTQPQQGAFISLIQPQTRIAHAQLPTAIQPQQLSGIPITPCVQPSTSFQLSNLATPVAQSLTPNPLGLSTKNLTFVNPAATTVWGLTPGRSGAYLIPQVMVPGAQVVQSQGVTPQIIQLAPHHQGNGKI